jgi:ComF family protein
MGAAGLDLVFPPRCTFCDGDLADKAGAATAGFCRDCEQDLTEPLGPSCARCAARVPAGAPYHDCAHCRDPRRRFERTVALGRYRNELRDAVLRTKRAWGEPLAMALGRLLATVRGGEIADLRCDLAAPVPMHWSRRLARGTNGPELIAESLAAALGVRPAADLLYFRRRTATQASLSARMRFANVRQALGVRRRWTIGGARVLLVDDVMTSGATASEAAKVLHRAGAEAVFVAVVARADGV